MSMHQFEGLLADAMLEDLMMFRRESGDVPLRIVKHLFRVRIGLAHRTFDSALQRGWIVYPSKKIGREKFYTSDQLTQLASCIRIKYIVRGVHSGYMHAKEREDGTK